MEALIKDLQIYRPISKVMEQSQNLDNFKIGFYCLWISNFFWNFIIMSKKII